MFRRTSILAAGMVAAWTAYALAEGPRHVGPPDREARLGKAFKVLDANGDGKIDRTEFDQRMPQLVRRMMAKFGKRPMAQRRGPGEFPSQERLERRGGKRTHATAQQRGPGEPRRQGRPGHRRGMRSHATAQQRGPGELRRHGRHGHRRGMRSHAMAQRPGPGEFHGQKRLEHRRGMRKHAMAFGHGLGAKMDRQIERDVRRAMMRHHGRGSGRPGSYHFSGPGDDRPRRMPGRAMAAPRLGRPGIKPPIAERGPRDKHRSREGHQGSRHPSKGLIGALDRNGDGKIDGDEMGRATEALKALDRNKDGVLDGKDMPRAGSHDKQTRRRGAGHGHRPGPDRRRGGKPDQP